MIPEGNAHIRELKDALFWIFQWHLLCYPCAVGRGVGQGWRTSRLASMEGGCDRCGRTEDELRDVFCSLPPRRRRGIHSIQSPAS